MAYTTPDPKQLDLSQKELLLMRLSQHIEQAQIDSPAYSLSNLAQKGAEEFVNEFLSDQPFLDSSTLESFMQTQLYVSSFWGLYDIVKILLDNKADVNFKNPNTLWTPLHAASFQDNGRVVMLLLEQGADPLSRDYKARTPADFASVSDKIWSHFDVLDIRRTPASELIKKGILFSSNQNGFVNGTALTHSANESEKTKSGIKLASYASSSNSIEKHDITERESRLTPAGSHHGHAYSPHPKSSQSGSTASTAHSGRNSTFTPVSTNSGLVYDTALSSRSNSGYGSTPISSRSRNSVSDSSQMKRVFGSDTTIESPISTQGRRSSSLQNASSSMSSLLSWE